MSDVFAPHAPDLIDPILGWRSWRMIRGRTRSGVRLASVHHEVVWPARKELVAECERRHLQWRPPWLRANAHVAPDRRCTCGIYAASSVEAAISYLDVYPWTRLRGCGSVLGLVQLWGSVVHCTRGWRGSFAYPLRLFVVASATTEFVRDATRDLAAYGVPIELLVTTPAGVPAELQARRLPLELPADDALLESA